MFAAGQDLSVGCEIAVVDMVVGHNFVPLYITSGGIGVELLYQLLLMDLRD